MNGVMEDKRKRTKKLKKIISKVNQYRLYIDSLYIDR